MDKWAMASAYGDELIAAYPEEPSIRALRATIFVSGYGDVAAANALFADAVAEMDPEYASIHIQLVLMAKDYDVALAIADDYGELFKAFPAGGREFLLSRIHSYKGDEVAAREYALKSVEALAPLVAINEVNLSIWKLLSAESYVRMEQPEEALRIARQVLEMNPLAGDAFDAPDNRTIAANIIAMAGEVDAGLEILAELVGKPGGPTKWDLQLDPTWRFMRDDARFATMAGLDGDSVSTTH